MPITYLNLASTVLTSAQASVTFSGISASYTDLLLKASIRGSVNSPVFRIRWNNDSGANYSLQDIIGQGGTTLVANTTDTGAHETSRTVQAGSNFFASTFTSVEVYLPNYTTAQNKPFSSLSYAINNVSSPANIEIMAAQWRNTATVSSIVIYPNTGNFVTDSAFYLYGIKNS